MKIAIIDTIIQLEKLIKGSYGFKQKIICEKYLCETVTLHGTNVANIIIDLCVNLDIEILSLAILNQNKKGTLVDLLKALEILQAYDVDVINISLGVMDEDNTCIWLRDAVDRVLSRLRNNGVSIICAYHNSNNESYPANNISTLGIKGGYISNNTFLMENTYDKTDIIVYYYKTYIRTNKETIYRKGNSYLCAKVTALYCQYKEELAEKKLNISFNEFLNRFNSMLDLQTPNLDLNSKAIIISNSGYEEELYKSFRNIFTNIDVKTTFEGYHEFQNGIYYENYIIGAVEENDKYLDKIIYSILSKDKCELIICKPLRLNIMKYFDYIKKRIHYIYL